LDEFDRLDELRREIAALPDDAPFAAWGKWFLSTDAARPIAPSFTVTPAEAQKLAETLAKVTPATPPPAAPTPATTPAPTPAPRP